jgi:hypothetical protein
MVDRVQLAQPFSVGEPHVAAYPALLGRYLVLGVLGLQHFGVDGGLVVGPPAQQKAPFENGHELPAQLVERGVPSERDDLVIADHDGDGGHSQPAAQRGVFATGGEVEGSDETPTDLHEHFEVPKLDLGEVGAQVLQPVAERVVVGQLGEAEDVKQQRRDVIQGARKELQQLELLEQLDPRLAPNVVGEDQQPAHAQQEHVDQRVHVDDLRAHIGDVPEHP